MRKWPVAIVILILAVSISGCIGKAATLSVYAVDRSSSPNQLVISIKSIDISNDGKNWIEVLNETKNIEISSAEKLIASKKIEIGNYSYVKIKINSVKKKINESYIDIIVSKPEIEFNKQISIKNDTKVLIIFDSEKSVITMGKTQIFQPVIQLSIL